MTTISRVLVLLRATTCSRGTFTVGGRVIALPGKTNIGDFLKLHCFLIAQQTCR